MSVILGVWMMTSAPTQEEIEAQQAAQEEAAAAEAAAQEQEAAEELVAEEAELAAPTDSAFAAAVGGPAREVVVLTDRYEATFSTNGGTPVHFRLLNYDQAGTDEPVELVSDERGALALGFNPPRGAYVDTRTLSFRPVVDGRPFEGDTLRLADGAAELRFEAPVADGVLRLAYGFEADSYDVDFRVETPGTDLLSQGGGYEVLWDGPVPLAEADVKGETQQAGVYLRSGGESEFLRLTEAGALDPMTRSGDIEWVAVKTKFFVAAIIPASGTQTDGAELTAEQTGEVDSEDFAQDYAARIEMPELGANESDAFTLYLGPLEVRRLAAYGLYDTVDFGFGQFMTRPIARYLVAPVFAFLGTFLPNYGLVIILFALLVKLVLWPLTAVSYRSAAKMRELQPQLTAIKEKYGDDPQKQQEAMMRMYREAGVNPLGGCLPMLLQYPILIALWRYFQNTLILRGESFLWANDLSAPDPILNLPFTIPFYGDFVAGFTLLMGLSMIVSMRLSMSGSTAMGGQQKVLMYTMPAVFFLFFNGFPSGLSLYYLGFNIFSIVQQRMINKEVHDAHERGETPEIDKAAAIADRVTNKGKNGRAKRPGRRRGMTTEIVSGNKRGGKGGKRG